MNNYISEKTFKSINNFIEEKFGLYFTKERTNDIVRALSNASKKKNICIEEYINLILLNKLSYDDLTYLATCLTIGETYFFRDKNLFKVLRERLFPDIINTKRYSNRSLKIWSAGCSSGEEPYSIAILIKELIPDYKNWNIEIIATDINENSLDKARNGIYSEWSFRGLDLSFKNRYFKVVDNKNYKIDDDIMKFVTFYNLNLASNIYLLNNRIIDDVDVIFCRNVLMYFSEEVAQQIIRQFYNIINNGGWLIGAPTENLYFNDTSFKPVNIENTFLYNKDILIKYKEKKDTSESLFTINIEDLENSEDTYSDLMETEKCYQEKTFCRNDMMAMSVDESYEDNKMNEQEPEALCRSFANEGKLVEALEWCKKAIDKDKINPIYYQLLADIEQELGNFSGAYEALKKAVFLDSNFIMAYFNLGNLNLKRQKLKDAFKNFENVRLLIEELNEKDIIPYSEKITVGMLKQIIDSIYYERGLYGKN